MEQSKAQHKFLVVYPRGHAPTPTSSVTLAPGTTIRTGSGENPFVKMEKFTRRSPTLRAWLEWQIGMLGAKRPRTAPPDQWEELQVLRRRLIADEACRYHVMALLRGDEAAAMRFADLYLRAPRAEGDADPRLALAITALAADAARPVHPAWIDEAAADGIDRPDLRTWAERLLGR